MKRYDWAPLIDMCSMDIGQHTVAILSGYPMLHSVMAAGLSQHEIMMVEFIS